MGCTFVERMDCPDFAVVFLKGQLSPTRKAPEGAFRVKREPVLIESDAFAIAELRIRILGISLMYCSYMITEDSTDASIRVAAQTA